MTTFDDLRARHTKGYASASDEAWERDPICTADGHAWPCDTAEALNLAQSAAQSPEETPAAKADKAQTVDDIIDAAWAVIADQSDIWAANSAKNFMHRVAKAARAEGRVVAEKMRGDVHHHVNPYIGMLRYDFQESTGVDPLDIGNDETGLPDVADLPGPFVMAPSLVVSTVRAMRAATDAADAALGEKPMREQIADLQAQMATQSNDNQNGTTA